MRWGFRPRSDGISPSRRRHDGEPARRDWTAVGGQSFGIFGGSNLGKKKTVSSASESEMATQEN